MPFAEIVSIRLALIVIGTVRSTRWRIHQASLEREAFLLQKRLSTFTTVSCIRPRTLGNDGVGESSIRTLGRLNIFVMSENELSMFLCG